jgi:uncharacterized damage-inducible protein DinB
MAYAAAFIAELEQESAATRRTLERVPADQLEYRPHPKSMTLGQLALHIAGIPGSISAMAAGDGLDVATVDFTAKQPADHAQILATLDASLERARAFLSGLDETACAAPWRLSHGEREIFTLPRLGLLRTLLLNHWYHHRGQLTVYLRLLDVPVPAVYGNSADENPLAG